MYLTEFGAKQLMKAREELMKEDPNFDNLSTEEELSRIATRAVNKCFIANFGLDFIKEGRYHKRAINAIVIFYNLLMLFPSKAKG